MTSQSPTSSLPARSGTAVVLFSGEWMPWTRDLRAFLTAGSLPDGAQLIEVDVDLDTAAPALAGLRCIPTVQVWKDGQKVATRELAAPGADLADWLKAAV